MDVQNEGIGEGGGEYEEEEDDYLYGDLEDAGRSIAIHQLQQRCESLQKQNETLKAELAEVKAQVLFLLEQKTTLEGNVVSIFTTAQKEIMRKDKQLSDLRIEFVNAQKGGGGGGGAR